MRTLAEDRLKDKNKSRHIFRMLAEFSVKQFLDSKNCSAVEDLKVARRDTVVELTCNKRYRDLNVLQYAAKHKAFAPLEVISNYSK